MTYGTDTSEAAITPSAPVSEDAGSLRRLTISGSTWTLLEYGVSQGLRFVSNWLLLQLITQTDAFGLMFIVSIVMQGLVMFSDIGTGPSIIQNKRGEDPRFLNTAWVLQITRGLALFVAALAITWPVARFYNEPMLLQLLPVAALAALVSAFDSTKLDLMNRQLRMGVLAAINIGSQAAGIVCTLLLAWWFRNVWALVIGGAMAAVIKTAVSHVLCPGPPNRFQFDRELSREMIGFGRWIFISTVLGYVVSRVDSMILGKYLAMAEFGVYFVAAMIAQAVIQAVYQISSRVLFPVYTRVMGDAPEVFRPKIFRVRAVLMLIVLPPLCVLTVWGDWIVRLIFPAHVHAAGWMLQILAAGGIVSAISGTLNPALLAAGDSYRYMLLQGTQTVFIVAAMLIGERTGGFAGILAGVAIAGYLNYPLLAASVYKYRVWMPALDAAGFAGAGSLIGLGFFLTR
ncbi:MAG: hypothetical protein AMXMBFR84_24260 [Candidatus Hydrogenedentota bacterium]